MWYGHRSLRSCLSSKPETHGRSYYQSVLDNANVNSAQSFKARISNEKLVFREVWKSSNKFSNRGKTSVSPIMKNPCKEICFKQHIEWSGISSTWLLSSLKIHIVGHRRNLLDLLFTICFDQWSSVVSPLFGSSLTGLCQNRLQIFWCPISSVCFRYSKADYNSFRIFIVDVSLSEFCKYRAFVISEKIISAIECFIHFKKYSHNRIFEPWIWRGHRSPEHLLTYLSANGFRKLMLHWDLPASIAE